MEELISNHLTDVICLEEVDHYDDFFKAFVENLGFDTLFCKKVGEGADGVVLCWKKKKLELLEHKTIQYETGSSHIALFARFKVHDASSNAATHHRDEVCIATTHLKAKEGNEEKRLKQGHILLSKIQEFLGEKKRSYSNHNCRRFQ